jgi:hypothetical protein
MTPKEQNFKKNLKMTFQVGQILRHKSLNLIIKIVEVHPNAYDFIVIGAAEGKQLTKEQILTMIDSICSFGKDFGEQMYLPINELGRVLFAESD